MFFYHYLHFNSLFFIIITIIIIVIIVIFVQVMHYAAMQIYDCIKDVKTPEEMKEARFSCKVYLYIFFSFFLVFPVFLGFFLFLSTKPFFKKIV